MPRLSDTETAPVLLHMTETTIRFPAVLALVKARLLVVPEVTCLERSWTKAGVATAAPAGSTRFGPMSAATTSKTQTPRRSGRRYRGPSAMREIDMLPPDDASAPSTRRHVPALRPAGSGKEPVGCLHSWNSSGN